MPPRQPRQDPVLETYSRQTNPIEEKEIDENIMQQIQSFLPISPSSGKTQAQLLNALGYILSTVVELSGKLVNRDYIAPVQDTLFLEQNPNLQKLLKECVEKKDFTKIRNLKILAPPANPEALARVQKKHYHLFERLHVVTGEEKKWAFADLDKFGNNAELHDPDSTTVPESIRAIEVRLLLKRKVVPSNNKIERSDRNLLENRYPDDYAIVFTSDTLPGQRHVGNTKEFIALFNIHYGYICHVPLVDSESTSSAYKTSTFCVYFIHPSLLHPFIKSDKMRYTENKGWGFPMFVKHEDGSEWLKYTPVSDFKFGTKDPHVPLLISEVVSQEDELDEARMLMQTIALARLGTYMIKPESGKEFFLVAIYLGGDLSVRRYIVKAEDKTSRAKVHIAKKIYELNNSTDANSFFLEMLNLAAEMEELADSLDKSRMMELVQLKDAASSMKSLHTKKKKAAEPHSEKGKSAGKSTEKSSPFDSTAVQRVLESYNLHLYLSAFHSNIAVVYNDDGKLVEYLKFVEDGSKELEFLHHFAQIDSPHNHVVRPTRSLSVEGGTIVSLSPGGIWITELKDISKYLFNVVHQLCEGVGFLHACDVAHLDIKPHNLVIPANYGKLTIIDFDASVHILHSNWRMKGLFGSEGYIAPEVDEFTDYDPIRADLYSCGAVIKELCELASTSNERDVLLALSSRLMDRVPENRPMMNEVLALFEDYVTSKTTTTTTLFNGQVVTRTLISV